MKIEKIKGLVAAPFTPMKPDGELNLSLIRSYAAMLSANKISGAFINGSTGEGVSTTIREKLLVTGEWVKQSSPDLKIINHLASNAYADCIEMAVESAKTGVYAVALTSPSYFKPANVNLLADFFLRVAEKVPDLPVYYYHVPVLTGGSYYMIDFIKEVAPRAGNFAGIKYTHEDFMDFLSCLNYEAGKYDMLWGRDENLLSALALGAIGGVGSTFNYAAPLYHRLIEAYNKGDITVARDLQQKSVDMIRLLGKYGGISTGKAYMRYIGLDCGGFRLPVKNMNDDEYNRFTDDVRRLGIEELFSVM